MLIHSGFVRAKARPRAALALLAACAGALLAGCATNTQFAQQVVDANLAQETASNQLTLLNVARGFHRHPMHFTRIDQVRMPVGAGNPTFSLPVPFGADRGHLYTLSTQLAVSQGVDTKVIDTQEFIRGITTPASPGLMSYYLDQGWPQQMILHLFVRAVEVYQTDKEGDTPRLITRLENYPQNKKRFTRFNGALESIAACVLELKPTGKPVPYGPVLPAREMRDLKGFAELKTAELLLVPVKPDGSPSDDKPADAKPSDHYRLAKMSKGMEFDLANQPGRDDCKEMTVPPDEEGTTEAVRAAGKAITDAIKVLRLGAGMTPNEITTPRAKTGDKAADPPKWPRYHANLVLRSPEAMLYYLGEIGRAQIEGQSVGEGKREIPPPGSFPRLKFSGVRAASRAGEARMLLFRMDVGAAAASAVKVDYLGKTYSVPLSDGEDRSMHTLSLITQILMLQNKGAEAPTTSNVRLVP